MAEDGMTKYVVMAWMGETSQWGDIATVKVPARTKRKTIIEKAMEQANASPPPDGWPVRVLDEENAREITVSLEEQPPRLKIG